jgi:zinc/manganese transport system substrate-binding protein
MDVLGPIRLWEATAALTVMRLSLKTCYGVLMGYVRSPLGRCHAGSFDPARPFCPALRAWSAGLAALAALAVLGAWCAPASATLIKGSTGGGGKVLAVGAENQYADVISQIGGRYVTVQAVMNNPNADPHSFEASASVAEEVSKAQLVVQNGMGYDAFMSKIEAASPDAKRRVITVQDLLKVPSNAFNPHLWYDPRTMPEVAQAVAAALAKLEPARSAYFKANAKRFDNSLRPWLDAIAKFRTKFAGVPVAVTEPVGDYLLQAMGVRVLTPKSLQSAVMNGTDPSPQDISTQSHLISSREVRLVAYNEQVTDSLTETFLAKAKKAGVPVVAVYETMPTPGYDYQTWMMAEVRALQKALTNKVSTLRL